MDIRFSRYELTPKKRINRLSSLDTKEGVLLSSEIDGKIVFADYFPHAPLGDEPVDEFLKGFKDQKSEYQQKVLMLLHEDLRYRHFPAKTFNNHQLWNGSEAITSKVIKYKLLRQDDQTFFEALRRGVRVRLDANGMFTPATYPHFVNSIPEEYRSLIDYVEDPLASLDWSSFPFPRARDFVEGSPFEVYIFKPVCELRPSYSKLVFSAYLGQALGTWHTYCEMIEHGDLKETQGILGFDFYDDVPEIFEGSYDKGFTPNLRTVAALYDDLEKRNWEPLCSM